MGETTSSGPGDIRRRLIDKSVADETFRERLLADPRGALERELGRSLPEGIEVKVVEETPESVYLVLPPKAATSQGGGELSERDLEAVAGGFEDPVRDYPATYGVGSTCARTCIGDCQ
jgi:hypothetical protein